VSLVRSLFEYASIIRSPYQISHTNRLSKVQNKFLKMSSFRCGTNSYNFRSPTEWRIEFGVTFIYKLLNYVIDAPDLLSKLSLAIPSF